MMRREKGPGRVAQEIGFPLPRLKAISSATERHFRGILIDKAAKYLPHGAVEQRQLYVPTWLLSQIQRRIRYQYLNAEVPNCVHGGISGRSNITNASAHSGNKFFFATDIRNFFPSVSPAMVYAIFRSVGLSGEAASLLTRLTTFDGGLPQGAPTSMHLANLVMSPVDEALSSYCVDLGIVYTRYVDDLAFSATFDFQDRANHIIEIVANHYFHINHRKTYYSVGYAEITGIVITPSGLRIPDRLFNKLNRFERNTPEYKSLKSYIERVYAATRVNLAAPVRSIICTRSTHL